MHCLGEGTVLAQPRDCPVPLGAGGGPRGCATIREVFGVRWCQESRGRASTESPWHPVGLWAGCGHGRTEGPRHGVTHGGISSTTNPTRCSHTTSSCSRPHLHRHPRAHTPAHHSTSPGDSRSPRAGPCHGWDFNPTRIRTFQLCPPCPGFTDSLETVTGAGEVRSIKQRDAARAGDSNNKSCCVQWLKLVFKKCPEKNSPLPKHEWDPSQLKINRINWRRNLRNLFEQYCASDNLEAAMIPRFVHDSHMK